MVCDGGWVSEHLIRSTSTSPPPIASHPFASSPHCRVIRTAALYERTTKGVSTRSPAEECLISCLKLSVWEQKLKVFKLQYRKLNFVCICLFSCHLLLQPLLRTVMGISCNLKETMHTFFGCMSFTNASIPIDCNKHCSLIGLLWLHFYYLKLQTHHIPIFIVILGMQIKNMSWETGVNLAEGVWNYR